MRTAVVFLLLGAMAISACGQANPTLSAPPTVAQRQVCGLPAETCAGAIGAVIRQVPEMAASPIAAAAMLDPDRLLQRGGDFEVLVAFAPFDRPGPGINPPTWIVTRGMLSSEWQVARWQGPLPNHFVTILLSAGLPT